MHFAPGQRPDAGDLRRALDLARVGMVSHVPDAGSAGRGVSWAELLASGLTFDAIGLAPGRPIVAAKPRTWRGLAIDAAAVGEAIGLMPGPHLAGAGHLLPVLKVQFGLAAAILSHCRGAIGAVWVPASVGIGLLPFIDLAGHWCSGGPFPAPALIEVANADDGSLLSQGMKYFIGCEIRIRADAFAGAVEGRRLLFRLADHLVERGILSEPQTIALDGGSQLSLDRHDDEIVASRI